MYFFPVSFNFIAIFICCASVMFVLIIVIITLELHDKGTKSTAVVKNIHSS